jgi:hypothetical protein
LNTLWKNTIERVKGEQKSLSYIVYLDALSQSVTTVYACQYAHAELVHIIKSNLPAPVMAVKELG